MSKYTSSFKLIGSVFLISCSDYTNTTVVHCMYRFLHLCSFSALSIFHWSLIDVDLKSPTCRSLRLPRKCLLMFFSISLSTRRHSLTFCFKHSLQSSFTSTCITADQVLFCPLITFPYSTSLFITRQINICDQTLPVSSVLCQHTYMTGGL